jgi:hypothetical protein
MNEDIRDCVQYLFNHQRFQAHNLHKLTFSLLHAYLEAHHL